MQKTEFSIIIPVYNVAPYLRECLDSVLAQTFVDWEAICVDDGSTDGSDTILNEYAAKDGRFKVFHCPNAGVSAARNFGLDHIVGRYVGFVDADDKIQSEWLAEAAQVISESSPDLVRMNAFFWHEDGSLTPDSLSLGLRDIKGRGEIVEWAWTYLLSRGWSWLFFINAKLLAGLRFDPNLKIREDTIFVLRLMARADSFIQSPYAGYCYRWHGGSAYNGHRTILESAKFPAAIISAWREAKVIAPILSGAEYRRLVSRIILNGFVEWMQRCDRREWEHDEEFKLAFNSAFKEKFLELNCANGRWKFPLFVFMATQWLGMFYTVQRIFEKLSKLKKVLAQSFADN